MTDEKMIQLICSGGQSAASGLKALYQSYATQVQRFCVAQGASKADAEDIWQQTAIKVVKAADSFRGDGKASAWIWQIARNNLLEHLAATSKRGAREQTVSDETWSVIDAVQTDADAVARQRSLEVDDCVSHGLGSFSRVDPDRAYALTLQMDGYSIEEVGTRIGRGTSATKQYLYEIRKKIEPYIANCFDLLKPESAR